MYSTSSVNHQNINHLFVERRSVIPAGTSAEQALNAENEPSQPFVENHFFDGDSFGKKTTEKSTNEQFTNNSSLINYDSKGFNHKGYLTISKAVNIVIDFFKKTCLMVRNATFLLIHRVVHGKTIVSSSQCLINSTMDYASRNQIYKAVAAISIDKREDEIVTVKSMIKPEMEASKIVAIFKLVAKAEGERKESIKKAAAFISPGMDQFKIEFIICKVALISIEKLEGIEKAAFLIKPEMKMEGIIEIINTIAEIPVEDREDVLEKMKSLGPKIREHQIISMIKAIAKIPVNKRG